MVANRGDSPPHFGSNTHFDSNQLKSLSSKSRPLNYALRKTKGGPSIQQGYSVSIEGVEVRDLHRLVVETFRKGYWVAFYVACMILPSEFESDCREGICGSCCLMINGQPHGPELGAASCQIYMRSFKNRETISIEPWLFPSLWPSALLHAYHPSNPAARFYNTVLGHFIGIGSGYLSVFIFHAGSVPAVLSTEKLTYQRIGASVLATFLTVSIQIPLKAFHPPAAATTLLIALGAFKFGLRELQILIIGVLIVAILGEFFRRLRL